ncbi:MAG TPA: hypothetical protein H9911_02670 [Candidatus Mediterraneibacter tabaqchaliae]|uniref:Uncharacterized protein n=1 Tax=Candidatus Mediterraneibacter tabaqchaliae TaxID=2838689 RepID=A0A9D2U0U8_9FIRM|nr:hypothetical protein [Candidatus Mediterraneibacter tabaqchaliae]
MKNLVDYPVKRWQALIRIKKAAHMAWLLTGGVLLHYGRRHCRELGGCAPVKKEKDIWEGKKKEKYMW